MAIYEFLSDYVAMQDSFTVQGVFASFSDQLIIEDSFSSNITDFILSDTLQLVQTFYTSLTSFHLSDTLTFTQSFKIVSDFAFTDIICFDEGFFNKFSFKDLLIITDMFVEEDFMHYGDMLYLSDNFILDYNPVNTIIDRLTLQSNFVYINQTDTCN